MLVTNLWCLLFEASKNPPSIKNKEFPIMNLLSSQYGMDVGFIELTIGTNILVECF